MEMDTDEADRKGSAFSMPKKGILDTLKETVSQKTIEQMEKFWNKYLDKHDKMEDNGNYTQPDEFVTNKNVYNKIPGQMNPFDHITDELKTKLANAGLKQNKIQKIVSLPKSMKPLPNSYLSEQYISNHLKPFRHGSIVKIMPFEPRGTIGGKGGTFVMSEQELNEIIQSSGMNIATIEKKLGFDKGYLGDNPVIVKFNMAEGLRMPQGNELGADPNYWIPGGYTNGGIREAVIDPAAEGTYTFKHFFD